MTKFVKVNSNGDIVNIAMITRIEDTPRGCKVYTVQDNNHGEYTSTSHFNSELSPGGLLSRIHDVLGA